MSQTMTREKVSNEALYILKSLRENSRLGRSNKLADVKAVLEPSVSLEFDSYFFFLRKFHYIAMDREAQLKLTDQGERVVDGDALDKFAEEVGQFFADQLSSDTTGAIQVGDEDIAPATGTTGIRPPPPPQDILLDAPAPPPAVASSPSSSSRGRKSAPPPPPA